jgi:hypothetical protein
MAGLPLSSRQAGASRLPTIFATGPGTLQQKATINMPLIAWVIVVAIIVAVIDHFLKIAEPWRKIIYVGLIVLFVFGLILLIFPGIFPLTFR